MKKGIRNVAWMFACMFLLSACSGSNNESSDSSATAEDTTEEVAPDTAAAVADDVPEGPTIALDIEANDAMRYNKTELKVRAGQEVTLTLHHVGTQTVKAMGHNWVLLAQGTDVKDFATKAASASDNNYIPKDMEGDVIAHTKTIGGGETTTVTFTAPAAGEYDYICSFPGHYALMHGKLIVE